MDRIDLLRIFLRVAATGSFSQAADQLALPRPTVSLAVQQLEARLGTRLLHRTTRKVALTLDGQALVDSASSLVDEMQDLEQRFRPNHHAVAGRLRIDVPSRVARLLIAPALPALLAQHPGLEVDLGSSDRAVDLVLEHVDCALRVGPLADSSLVAKPLGAMALINCASPAYLARHGTPHTVANLQNHNLLAFNFRCQNETWPFLDGAGGTLQVTPQGNTQISDGDSMRQLVLAGMGIGRFSRLHVQPDIDQGRLLPVLEAFNPGDREIVHAVFVGPGQQVPARVRVMLDYLLEKVKLA